MSLTKKCPVCNADALLQDSKPVPSEGCYSKIYKCDRGHVYRQKIFFKGIKRTVTQILEGGKDGPVQDSE